jgi:flagellar M-ring protein FliF
VNYEVDKAIEYLKANKGQLRRVSAAVVVNYKPGILKDGQPTPAVPYTAEEIQQINGLVRDAVGYVERRGDTVSVANIPFSVEPVEKVPFYKEAGVVDLIKELTKFGLLAAALVMVYFTIVRTLIAPKKAAEPIQQKIKIGDEFDEKVKAEMAALDPQLREQRMLEIQNDFFSNIEFLPLKSSAGTLKLLFSYVLVYFPLVSSLSSYSCGIFCVFVPLVLCWPEFNPSKVSL